jgi:hypothetical protein
VGKELIVLLLGVLLQLLVSDGPLLPVFMGIGLHLVVMQVMLLLLLLLVLRMPGLARAQLLVLALVGTDMRMIVVLLVILSQVFVGDWLLLPRFVGKGLTLMTVVMVL